MTWPRRSVAAAALAVGVVAWLAWPWPGVDTTATSAVADGAPTLPDVAPGSNRGVDVEPPSAPAADGERVPVPDVGIVRVRVLGPAASAATGILLAQPDRGTQTFARMPTDAPFRGNFANGSGHVQVDCRVATRLLVLDPQSGVRRHVRVEPFRGSTEVSVDLDPDQVIVHVLVLDSGLDKPVPGCEVLAQAVGSLSGDIAARATTNVHGEATLGVDTGELSFRTERASAVDATPWRRTLRVAPRCEAAESFLILATPPARYAVQLDVHVASLGQGGLDGPRLFLRSLDGGDVVPLRHRLQLGPQILDASVFEGTYEVDALPFGQVDVRCPDGPVLVGKRGRDKGSRSLNRVNISPRSDRAMVTLRGVEHDEYPLRVTLREPEACPSVGQDLYVLGPTAWHVPAHNLPRWTGRKEFVVFTRRRALLSRGSLACVGASMDVDLVPATLVRVCCPSISEGRSVLTVVHGGGSLVVPLRLDIVRENLVDRPALVADVVVPHGSATFDCGVDERLAWRKTVILATGTTVLP